MGSRDRAPTGVLASALDDGMPSQAKYERINAMHKRTHTNS